MKMDYKNDDIITAQNTCGLDLSPILETFYDLSYHAGYDALSLNLEIDSREMYFMLVDLARRFETKYKGVDWDSGEVGMSYLEAVDKYYTEWKNELIAEYKLENFQNELKKHKISCTIQLN